MKIAGIFGITLAAIALVAVLLFFSFEPNRLAISWTGGFVKEGAKFGVQIGQPADTAQASLAKMGWKFSEILDGHECLSKNYPDGVRVELYEDRTWRSGSLCLASKDNRVLSIEWDYTPFAI